MDEHHQPFEQHRQVDSENVEFWSARELSKILDYSEYRHFAPVLERAKEACLNSGQAVEDHFEEILDMVKIGSGASSWPLTCFAQHKQKRNCDVIK
jgi:DNA-damage-inducible protein D